MIKRCPITYLPIEAGQAYSPEGLKLLSPRLTSLAPLPFTAQELRMEALASVDKISIQGVQYKLSAILNIKQSCFDITHTHGKFILKPQSDAYPHLPENEDLSMRLAKTLDIEVPLHGMIYGIDGKLTYFIKRFDRAGHKDKLPVEDFAQLSGSSRGTKYDFSMERIIGILDKFCTFPQIEKNKLFIRTIFNFLIGNEDMHLKNFSLITRDGKVELAPAYDFINSTLVIPRTKEEIALPLNGKKNNLKYRDLIEYLAYQKLDLSEKSILNTLKLLKQQIPIWKTLIQSSFLTDQEKKGYWGIVEKRLQVFL